MVNFYIYNKKLIYTHIVPNIQNQCMVSIHDRFYSINRMFTNDNNICNYLL